MILDFAGLADYHIESGSPLIWASYESFHFVRSVDEAWALNWREIDRLVMRYGDPRIEAIMDLWRDQVAQAQGLRDNPGIWDHAIHGKHLALLFTHWVSETHVIPKSLPTVDSDHFDPASYHSGGNAKVFAWGDPAAEQFIHQAAGHGIVCYIETGEHYLSWHGSMPILPPNHSETDMVMLLP